MELRTNESMWMSLTSLVNDLTDHPSRYDKEKILSYYPDLKTILHLVYDPYTKFHVTSNSLFTDKDSFSEKEYWDIFDLLQALSSRKITGDEARYHVQLYIERHAEFAELIERALDRDLGCGISVKTINKVFPGLIQTFEVPLAKNYEVGKHDVLEELHFASRKLDGIRCLTLIEYETSGKKEITFYSRNGKQFHTLGKIEEDLQQNWFLPGSYVIDGEVCLIDQFGHESFQGLLQEIQNKNHTIPNPYIKVFDVYSKQEFMERKANVEYSVILKTYQNAFNLCTNVGWLEQIPIYSMNDLEQLVARMPREWEGYILRRNAPTMFKRSSNLLKIKHFMDAEFIVEDIIRSKKLIEGKERDCIGSLVIRYEGDVTTVGSGISDAQRISWYHNPDQIIGKQIIVKYFRPSKNKSGGNSLKWPTLKSVIQEKI